MADDDKTPEVEDRGDDVVTEEPKAEDKTEEPKAEDKTEEPKAEEAKAEEDDTPPSKTIPFTRFKAQNLRLKEAEAELAKAREELAEAKKASEPAPKEEPKSESRDFDAEVTAAEAKLEAALTDNDAKAILAAQRELRGVEKAQMQAEIDAIRGDTKATQDQIAQAAFDETLALVEQEYPELDPNSDVSDAAKQDAVQALLNAYEQQGYASDDALVKAVGVIYPEQAEKTAEPAEGKKADRGIEAKVDAASKTPPNLAKAGGENSDAAGADSEIDAAKLSDEEYDKLPEATKKRLRGDTIAA